MRVPTGNPKPNDPLGSIVMPGQHAIHIDMDTWGRYERHRTFHVTSDGDGRLHAWDGDTHLGTLG